MSTDTTNLLVDAIRDKRQYLKQKDIPDSQFFLCLSEFVLFVQSLREFSKIESEMQRQKKNDLKESERLEKRVLKDIEKVRIILLGKLTKKNIDIRHLNDPGFKQYYSPGTNENQRYKDLKSGKLGISGDKTTRLHEIVKSMLWGLHETGHREIIAPYVAFGKYGPGYTTDYPENKEYIASYHISSSFEEYSFSLEQIKLRYDVAPWSVYEQLLLIPFWLYNYQQELNRRRNLLAAQKISLLDILDLRSRVSEMKSIVNGTEKNPLFFKREKYINLLEQFTFFVIDQLCSLKQGDKANNSANVSTKSTLQSTIRLDTPSGTKWHQIKFVFFDKERAKIIVRGQAHEVTPTVMGMSDKRRKSISEPTKSWALLYLLAQKNGAINTDEKDGKTTKGELYRKAKQELTDKLCERIGISDDPFYPVDANKQYRLRMEIFVSTDNPTSNNSQVDLPKGEADENTDLYKELTSTS